MAKILNTRFNKNNVRCILSLDKDEFLNLDGQFTKLLLIPETDLHSTNCLTKARNHSAKYFLIPKKLGKKLNRAKNVRCKKLNFKAKEVFVYFVEYV